MKKRSWFLALVMLAGAAYALQKAAPLRGEWTPEQVAPGVYVIHGPTELPSPSNQGFMNNPAFVVTDAGVVVIDPGSSVQVGEMLLCLLYTSDAADDQGLGLVSVGGGGG